MRPVLLLILAFTALALFRPVWQDALWPGTRGSADRCMDWRSFMNDCNHDLIIGMIPPDYADPIVLAPDARITDIDLRRIVQDGEELIYCRPPFRPATFTRRGGQPETFGGCLEAPANQSDP